MTALQSEGSRADAVASLFRANPNRWLSALDLMAIGGSLSWRTRISDCRRFPHFLIIENRLRRVERPGGRMSVVSEYRSVVVEKVKSGDEREAFARLPLW